MKPANRENAPTVLEPRPAGPPPEVPFLDLAVQYHALRDELLPAINQVLEATTFAGGPAVAAFEEEFARFCGRRYAVGVGSGTEALWFALLGLGIGRGDEVITVANTFIATTEAISFAGATPVLVDIDARTYNMDPGQLEAAITPRTRAIIPVHLYGQMAEMAPILEVARRHGLAVIEDASQAHGAEYRGRQVGAWGDAGCFSFYPGKNLGAYGEAGAVVTDDEALAVRLRRLRDHGQSQKYYHQEIGWNGRMDGLQGAVLRVKLRQLPLWNEQRRRHARAYNQLLAGIEGLQTPQEAAETLCAYHLYVIRCEARDALLDALRQRRIFCGIHYPVPIHLQEAYRGLGLGPGAFPVTEQCAREILSLPMYAELRPQQIQWVAESVADFMQAR